MARQTYGPELKAAVMAALLDGQSVRQIEKELGVPKSTVAAWGKEMGDVVPSVPDDKKAIIGDLLIDLLVAKLESQNKEYKLTITDMDRRIMRGLKD